MNKKYGVAIIGCGQMGVAHIKEIYFKGNVNMEYACDLSLEKAMIFKNKYNVNKITNDYMECITSDDVDIVIISTYPSTHLPIVKACIENGKHVICEKPITGTIEESNEFVALVKSNPQCKVLIGHILRHNTTYQKVADMIHNGYIGSPIVFRMVQNHHTMDWNKYLTLIKETSPIVDCGVHYMDVMQWFAQSKIADVNAIGLRTEADVPEDKYNYGMITVKLEDGSIGYYEAGWGNTISSDNLKEFVGPKGRIRLIYRKDRHTNQEEGDLIEYYKYPQREYESINIQSDRKPTGAQFDYLVKMIETNCHANPTIDEVFESFQAVIRADDIIKNNNN